MPVAMQSLRAITIALSLAVHGSLGYALIAQPEMSVSDSFDAGTGNNSIFVEQGIAIEGLAKLGDAIETIETAEVTPIAAEPPPPLEEVDFAMPSPPKQVPSKTTSSRLETNRRRSSSRRRSVAPSNSPSRWRWSPNRVRRGQVRQHQHDRAHQYLGKLRDVLEKSKINPRSRLAGTVWVKFKVGPDGELISREITDSSGSKVLDDAAMAALDRAAPFPPMPNDVAEEPMVVSVPFKFITR